MADISSLGSLQSAEPLDLAVYKDASSGFTMPPKGRYTVRAPESFPPTAFGATKAGYLSAQIDPTIVGGPHDGFQLRYQKISAKVFKRGGQPASQFGDYFRAVGLKSGEVSGEPQQLANAVEATANRTYVIDLDWHGYDKTTGTPIDGMEAFPQNADGTYQPWIESATEKDEQGNPLKIRARAEITRFVTGA